jgi:hypothetical protein
MTYDEYVNDLLNTKIKETNNVTLDFSQLVKSDPTSIDPTINRSNTVITLLPLSGGIYDNSTSVYYNRTSFEDALTTDLDILSTLDVVLSDLMPSLSNALGITVYPEDYIDTPIPHYDPANPLAKREVTVVANSLSYLYYGSYTISLNPKPPIIDNSEDNLLIQIDYVVPAKSLILMTNDVINNDFYFLINTRNITTFILNKIVKMNSSSFRLFGSFSLDVSYDLGNTYSTITVSNLLIDITGYVLSSDDLLFVGVNTSKEYILTKSKLVTLDNTGTIITSYNLDGSLNNTMTLLDCVAEFIRPGLDDYFYIVTKPYNASVPYNSNNQGFFKITRYNSDISVDIDFTRVYIGNSVPTAAPFTALDLKALSDGGFYLLVKPVQGINITGSTPLVNGEYLNGIGELLSAPDTSMNYTASWNPCIKFLDDGSIDNNFNSVISNISSDTVFVNTSSVDLEPGEYISAIDSYSDVSYLTYSVRPVSSFLGNNIISFDFIGKYKTLSGAQYVDLPLPLTTYAVKLRNLNNFSTVSFGDFSLPVNNNLYYGSSTNMLIKNNADGSIDKVLFKSNNYLFGCSIKDVIVI